MKPLKPMNDNYRVYLAELRIAASTRQWNECRKNVKSLLTAIPQVDIARILTKQIKHFLSNASNTYPDDTDIVDEISCLVEVNSFRMMLDCVKRIYSILEKRSNQPGINNFRNALKHLMTLDVIEGSPEKYLDDLIDVLSGILMAILSHEWGNQNQDLWNKSFEQRSRSDAFILAKHFWPDPRTVALNEKLWNEVADDIEAAVTPRNSTDK